MSVPCPKVWSQFTATRKSDGKLFKLRVQEATANEKENVLSFLAKQAIPVENFLTSSGIFKSKKATEEMLKLYATVYDIAHITICYEDKESSDNPIIGLNMIALENKYNDDVLSKVITTLKEPETLKLLNILKVTCELYDESKKSGLKQYYGGWGLYVRTDYSGMGIGKELLRLRRVISKEHGVPATGAWMTATGSQKAAERDGWTTVFEIPFEELGRLAGCEFIGAPPMCKVMVAYTE